MENNKVSNFIFSPTKFFEGNQEKNSYMLPLILQVISTVLLILVTVPIAMNSQEVSANLTEEVKAIAGPIAMVTGVIGGVIGCVASILISTLIIFLCVKYILKGEVTFKPILSVYAFSLLPQVILNLIFAVIYKVTDNVSSDMASTILTKVNPFTIWSLILLIIGVHVVSKVSMKKSSILCIVLMAISIGTGMLSALIK